MEQRKGNLPTRKEIPDHYKWRLEDIYASDELWEQDFQQVKKLIDEAGAYRGKLGSRRGLYWKP